MFRSISACIFLTALLACNAPDTPPPSIDLEGFVLSEIPGTSLQKAVHTAEDSTLLAEGLLENGLKTGAWFEYHPGPKPIPKKLETYVQGQLQGISASYSARGQIEELAHYQNGQLHGRYVKFKYGRILEDHTYRNGLLDGYYRSYYENSENLQKEIEFKNGKENGKYRYYNEAGEVVVEYTYKDGEKLEGGMVQ